MNESNLSKRSINKLYAHWPDLFPKVFFGEFSVINSKKNNLGKLSSEVAANDRRTISFEQLRNIIDSPDVVKTYGTTIKTGEDEYSMYLPVIYCYHKECGLNIMIKIPERTYLTGFGLDDGQAIFKKFFEFVPPRVSEGRIIDMVAEQDNPEQYFPILFLKTKESFVKWFLDRLNKKRK